MKIHVKELKAKQPIALVCRKRKYINLPDSLWAHEAIHYADPINITFDLSTERWSVKAKVRRDDSIVNLITETVTIQNQ